MSEDNEEIEVLDNPVKTEEERLEHLRKDHTIGEHRAHIKEQVQDALEDTIIDADINEPEKQFVQDDYISIRIALEELRKERDMHEAFTDAWQEAANQSVEAEEEAQEELEAVRDALRAAEDEVDELKSKGRLYHLKKAFFP